MKISIKLPLALLCCIVGASVHAAESWLQRQARLAKEQFEKQTEIAARKLQEQKEIAERKIRNTASDAKEQFRVANRKITNTVDDVKNLINGRNNDTNKPADNTVTSITHGTQPHDNVVKIVQVVDGPTPIHDNTSNSTNNVIPQEEFPVDNPNQDATPGQPMREKSTTALQSGKQDGQQKKALIQADANKSVTQQLHAAPGSQPGFLIAEEYPTNIDPNNVEPASEENVYSMIYREINSALFKERIVNATSWQGIEHWITHNLQPIIDMCVEENQYVVKNFPDLQKQLRTTGELYAHQIYAAWLKAYPGAQ